MAGNAARALDAFSRVYYGSPLGRHAERARLELTALTEVGIVVSGADRTRLELERAERLFAGRDYSEAQKAFESLREVTDGGDPDLVALRLAQCEYRLGRVRPAREALRSYLTRGTRQAEALYFYALTARELKDPLAYVNSIRHLAAEFPAESWAQEALNNLGTYHILRDEDAEADRVFRELYDKYPRGLYAERAAWRIGWRAYRDRRYAQTVDYFERAAGDFPRSDFRPSWLYWAGRAHEHLNQQTAAQERHRLAAGDYLNSYYGRLAVQRLGGPPPAPRVVADGVPAPSPAPPNVALIRLLLGAERYGDALNELRYAQRVWGDTPAVQATTAWTYRQLGPSYTGMDQFLLLRGSITLTRRAYPQFMAAGGESLPREILTMIFPVAYWDLIRKYSALNGLDPYLVAALAAQESTFVPDIQSSAGAVGLLQLMPATARAMARKLKITYSSRLLTTPEANIRMGTAYLAEKIKEFGSLHLALASYNAGERPVRRWIAERPGLRDRAEFIDDIPYAETQNYVKRLLGTADDYRRIYQ
jgi:soluble lytic murein transglycosylase